MDEKMGSRSVGIGSDIFSKCPDDIKVEILNMVGDSKTLCSASRVSTSWNCAADNDRVWKPLYYRDFLWWNSEPSATLQDHKTWKVKYGDSFLKGWQFDPAFTNKRIGVSNNYFSATLSSGYSYHGVRASRGEYCGKHYFEVLVEPSVNEEDNLKFNQSSMIYMGVGVANDAFNVENCCSGWTETNSGVGFYNDGQIYALGRRHLDEKMKNLKIPYKTGDRVGFEMDMDDGTIGFFINGNKVSDTIVGLKGTHYPYVILANNVTTCVTITTGRKCTHVEKQLIKRSNEVHVKKGTTPTFEAQLSQLAEMGFVNNELCTEMLSRHSGDLQRVVSEVLGE